MLKSETDNFEVKSSETDRKPTHDVGFPRQVPIASPARYPDQITSFYFSFESDNHKILIRILRDDLSSCYRELRLTFCFR